MSYQEKNHTIVYDYKNNNVAQNTSLGTILEPLSLTEMLCDSMIRYMKGRHLVDVTEIYNQLSWEKKQRFFKIGYLLILFILSLFWYCDKNVFIDACKLLALFEALSYVFLSGKCDLGCFGALEMNMINHALLLSLSCPIVSLLI